MPAEYEPRQILREQAVVSVHTSAAVGMGPGTVFVAAQSPISLTADEARHLARHLEDAADEDERALVELERAADG